MRILNLVEHYPTTFKPYFDDLFMQFAHEGHEMHVMAHGEWTHGSDEPRDGLNALVISRYHTTIRTLPSHAPRLLGSALASPVASVQRAAHAARGAGSAKRAVLDAARALLLPGRPPDLIMIHNTTTLAYFPFLKRLFPETPLGFYYHGGEVAGTPQVRDAAELFRTPDVILTNTRASMRHAVSRGARQEDVEIIPVGFHLPAFPDPVQRSYRPDGTLRILAAGRLSEEKGFVGALHAIADIRKRGIPSQFTLVGDGPQQEEIRALVAQLGLEGSVSLPGYLPRTKLLEKLRACDVLLLPSIPTSNWEETQACILQEAMLMRAPVVSSRIGGVPESIPPEMTEFLFEPGDREAMAERLVRFANMPMDRMRELGAVGREFVTAGYDVSVIANRMLRTIVAAHKRRATRR